MTQVIKDIISSINLLKNCFNTKFVVEVALKFLRLTCAPHKLKNDKY